MIVRRLLGFALILVAAVTASAQQFPPQRGYVTDDTAMMVPEDKSALEARLAKFHAETKVEVCAVLVQSLGGLADQDYLLRLWNQWRVGNDGAGVVILVCPRDGRACIRFSPNLVGRLTDADCDYIQRTEMVPEFNQGHISAGVVRGAEAVLRKIKEAAAHAVPPPAPPPPEEDDWLDWVIGFGMLGVLLLVIYLTAQGQKKGGKKKR